MDQYYIGSNSSIQCAAVQFILDSVVEALERDPKKKFTYVEMAFFERWWFQQKAAKQQSVKNLVATGTPVFFVETLTKSFVPVIQLNICTRSNISFNNSIV